MVRSIAAVLAGLVVAVVLVITLNLLAAAALRIPLGGTPPPLYLALNLLGAAVAGASGGATAFRLAPHRPHGHVGSLALLLVLLSLPTLLAAPAPGQPTWYSLALTVLGPVSVFAGGFLAVRRVDRSPTVEPPAPPG